MLAIGMTLWLSWLLEGGVAAINDAGSERMRSFHLATLLEQGGRSDDDFQRIRSSVSEELEKFERVLDDLEQGDPVRPLAPPRFSDVQQGVKAIRDDWQARIRPIISRFLVAETRTARLSASRDYEQLVPDFVNRIDSLVLGMERNFAHYTALLRSFQIGLVVLVVVGTIILLRFFQFFVIRPVEQLQQAIQRMSDRDLSVRLPVVTGDEFGLLVQGFNSMAGQLESMYGTLEERVQTETRSLAARNRELAVLYEITSFLNEQGGIDVLCDGFLSRVRQAMGACAGTVRLYSAETGELLMVTHQGVSEEFVSKEQNLGCGDCLCNGVAEQGQPVFFAVNQPPPGMRLHSCVREGFATASAFTVSHNKVVLGVYNLYFNEPQIFSPQEVLLLETLGTHLGVAIENDRLSLRERELAVSEERNLLAQELHDSIAQGLAFLNIEVQLLDDSLRQQRIDEALHTTSQIREGIQESYDDVRELLVHFRTRVHQSDLDGAILAALEKFEGQTGIRTEFDRIGRGLPLPGEDEIQVMHIVQESLSNIRKHAKASEVLVRMTHDVTGLQIEIRDNGLGFDPVAHPNLASDRHVGLKIMRERAFRAGGQCSLISSPGQGTTVLLSLPRHMKENV